LSKGPGVDESKGKPSSSDSKPETDAASAAVEAAKVETPEVPDAPVAGALGRTEVPAPQAPTGPGQVQMQIAATPQPIPAVPGKTAVPDPPPAQPVVPPAQPALPAGQPTPRVPAALAAAEDVDHAPSPVARVAGAAVIGALLLAPLLDWLHGLWGFRSSHVLVLSALTLAVCLVLGLKSRAVGWWRARRQGDTAAPGASFQAAAPGASVWPTPVPKRSPIDPGPGRSLPATDPVAAKWRRDKEPEEAHFGSLPATMRATALFWVPLLVVGIVALVVAVWKEHVSPLRAAAILFLGSITAGVIFVLVALGTIFARKFSQAVDRDGPPRIESHWGGFGGGLGGWKVSESFAHLAAAAVAFAIAAFILSGVVDFVKQLPDPAKKPDPAKTEVAADGGAGSAMEGGVTSPTAPPADPTPGADSRATEGGHAHRP